MLNNSHLRTTTSLTALLAVSHFAQLWGERVINLHLVDHKFKNSCTRKRTNTCAWASAENDLCVGPSDKRKTAVQHQVEAVNAYRFASRTHRVGWKKKVPHYFVIGMWCTCLHTWQSEALEKTTLLYLQSAHSTPSLIDEFSPALKW